MCLCGLSYFIKPGLPTEQCTRQPRQVILKCCWTGSPNGKWFSPTLPQVYQHRAYNPHFPHCYFATRVGSDPIRSMASWVLKPHSHAYTPPTATATSCRQHHHFTCEETKLRQARGLAGGGTGAGVWCRKRRQCCCWLSECSLWGGGKEKVTGKLWGNVAKWKDFPKLPYIL